MVAVSFVRIAWGVEALFDLVITIPKVFVTGEAEEVIGVAAAGCGELNLVRGAHRGMLVTESWFANLLDPK
jgi:hypothetical protein